MAAIQSQRYGVQFGHNTQKAQATPKFQGKPDGPQSDDAIADYDARNGGGKSIISFKNLVIGALLVGAAFLGYRHFAGKSIEQTAEKAAESVLNYHI